MNRKHFLATALLGLVAVVIPRKADATPKSGMRVAPDGSAYHEPQFPVIGAGVMPVVTKTRAEVEEMYGKHGTTVHPMPALSGVNGGGGIWCQCPHCHGKGIVVGEGIVGGEDSCGYCRMSGYLSGFETAFGMFSREGDAEVFRALVWFEWRESNYFPTGKRPAPSLPGLLVNISSQHPEVNDTAVREAVYAWLSGRFGHDVAQAWIEQWAAEREYRDAIQHAHQKLTTQSGLLS